jgi:uncharacterized membrane protein YtjA (UPF0391 family)
MLAVKNTCLTVWSVTSFFFSLWLYSKHAPRAGAFSTDRPKHLLLLLSSKPSYREWNYKIRFEADSGCCISRLFFSEYDQGGIMLYWALMFLVVALIAGVLGFTGIAIAAAGVAKLLFVVFLVLFLISLATHFSRRGSGV